MKLTHIADYNNKQLTIMETLLFNGIDLTPVGVILFTLGALLISFLLPVIKKPQQSK